MLENYIVVDLEMTGLNAKRDAILEIGAIKVQEKQITGKFSRLIRQERKLEKKITELTGITDEMAAGGEELDPSVSAFLEFAEDLVWVGHNLFFDYSFIRQWEINHRIKRRQYAVDTLKIARGCLPELEKKSLDFLCGHYRIGRKAKHRALDDALANYYLYEILEKQFLEKEPELFSVKELQYRAKRQTPATQRQKNYLKELAEYHKIKLEIPEGQFTRSEASRMTDRIIREFGRM